MSSNVYEKQWTEAGGDALDLPDGVGMRTFALPFPATFEITKLICQLVQGTNSGFTLEIFNVPTADFVEDYGSDSSSVSEGTSAADELARVVPVQTAVDGLISVFNTGTPWSFRNMEGSLTVPGKRIFVRVTADGQVGDNIFELAIGGYKVTV